MNNISAGAMVAVIFILVTVAFFGLRFSSTTEGVHSGFVTTVQQNGYIFPNYQVYFKTDNSSSQEDVYCVNRNNTYLGKKLKELNLAKKRVSITYKGVRGFGIDLCEGQEITEVTEDKVQ